jgi:hypothetical protein
MRPFGRRQRASAALWLGFALCGADAQAATPIETGERIYRHGILPSGEPLRATVGQDVILSGARAACANCHRRSGYGGIEGTRVVPPVTAQYLFGDPPLPTAGRNARADVVSARSFYDATTFKRALREGLHFSGRPLSAPMPRYTLAESDLDLLIDHLKTLSVRPPGVSDNEIHFATIVTEGVPERQRQALLDVLKAFVDRQNAERRAPKKVDPRTQIGHGRAYRTTHLWRLHVWELKGSPDAWPRQMDRYYREQPVYAVLGGVGRGDWQAVHEYCERLQLPCLFPNVEQAGSSERDHFSIYFTRGVIQEAEVLAQSLLNQPGNAPYRIMQIYHSRDSGEFAARALRRALAGAPRFEIRDRPLTKDDTGLFNTWGSLPTNNHDAIALWLRDEDLARLPDTFGLGALLYISDSLLVDPEHALPVSLRSRTFALVLRELPSARPYRRLRFEDWLRTQGLTLTDERIQANTYLVLTLVSRALSHMRSNHSREYLIERIEHLAQTGSWVSPYPGLHLASGQRVASRGGYRVPLRGDGSLPANAPWVVPGVSTPE